MSEIIKFILDNFSGLRPLDYLLLLLVAAITAVAAVLFFRWLFRARFEAQRELLEIREATIETVKQQLASLKQDYKELQDEAVNRAERLRRAAAEKDVLESGHKATAQVAATALVFSNNVQYALLASSAYIIFYERLELVYRQFYVYTLWRVADHVDGAPAYAEIAARLEKVGDRLANTADLFEHLYEEYMNINRTMDVVKAAASVDTDAINSELTEVGRAMSDALAHFVRALEASTAKPRVLGSGSGA